MTVTIAVLCTDGVVLAADSMLTSASETHPAGTGRQVGRKLHVIGDDKLYAWCGNQGHADRFRMRIELAAPPPAPYSHLLEYPLALAENVLTDFEATRISNSIDCEAFLAFHMDSGQHCCAFNGPFQPLLLNEINYFMAQGSGKQLADPFLKYITDILCPRQPNVNEAVFLAYWTILHVIEAGPGGVDHPIRIATLAERGGKPVARELDGNEIGEQRQAVESLKGLVRDWRDQLNGSVNRPMPMPPMGPSKMAGRTPPSPSR